MPVAQPRRFEPVTGTGCSLSRRSCWHPFLRLTVLAPWGLARCRVHGREVVYTAMSLELKALGGQRPRQHYLCFADGMQQRGQSQALDVGGVVLAGDSAQRAAGEPILPRYLLLELLLSKPGVRFSLWRGRACSGSCS